VCSLHQEHQEARVVQCTHGADFKPRAVNPEAEDESNQMELWKLSAQIVGVD
jgi:hypothetical protein